MQMSGQGSLWYPAHHILLNPNKLKYVELMECFVC